MITSRDFFLNMIKISMALDSLHMSFTQSGLFAFVSVLKMVLEREEAMLSDVIFVHGNEERKLNLVLKLNKDTCFKLRKHELCLSLEREDAEDSVARFEAARDSGDLYPEWVQAVNLGNKKHSYVYVSMQPGVNL